MSTTALAEYADMLFTRAHLALGNRHWWLELRPDSFSPDPKAIVVLRANVRNRNSPTGFTDLSHRCKMHAVEENVAVGLPVLEQVIDLHLADFVRRVRAAENGELVEQRDG